MDTEGILDLGDPIPSSDASPVSLLDTMGESPNPSPSSSATDLAGFDASSEPVVLAEPASSDLTSSTLAPVEEASLLSQWNEQHSRELLEKREKAEQRTADLRARAKKEIEDFMAEREAKIAQSRKENRNGEEEVMRDLHSTSEGEERSAWESIAKIVDLSAGKTKGKDVSRMRQLLLEAKQK